MITKKEITIYDIAKEAGVSTATVSRVLTNSANVSLEKKERIQSLIELYNFKPNALARKLSDQSTKVIGILTADIRNPFYAALFVACEIAANKKGYTLVLYNSLNEKDMEEHYLEKLEEQRVDAIILVGGRVDELVSDVHYVECVNKISNHIPIILTGKLDGTDCYQVNINQIQGMDLMMRHLVEKGHEKIALVGGLGVVKSTYEKRQRYIQLLDKFDMPVNRGYIIDGGYDERHGYLAMCQLLESELPIPTAIIAINDMVAIGIMKAAMEHQIKIPQDLALASFDNTFLSQMTMPKLTSIDYNYDTLGEILIETALKAIEHETISKIQFVDTRLIVREST